MVSPTCVNDSVRVRYNEKKLDIRVLKSLLYMARSHLHAMIGNCDSVKSLKAPFACLTDLCQG